MKPARIDAPLCVRFLEIWVSMFGKSRGPKGLGSALLAFSRAQAQWEIQVGRTILARRKKWLALALAPALLGLIWSSAAGQPPASAPATAPAATSAPADSHLPHDIPILGGSKAIMPSLANWNMFYGSILVGLIAGLITGVIGAGGGYILTPALMSFGVRGIMSVGTDQFHLFAKAIMGTTIHRKLGNVNVRLAVWFVAGSFVGVTLGGLLTRAIFLYSPALSDAVISLVYVVVLGSLALYAIADWRRRRSSASAAAPSDGLTDFARRLQGLSFRPRVHFDEMVSPGGRSICVYPVILCGLLVGFVASIMGVGGGFLTFPMFVYGLGVSTFTTVGTDILQIIFTAGYSSIFQYAIYGFVFYSIAIGMLVGSLIGVQMGAMVTTVVKGAQIRAFFALTILAGFFNRLFALPRKLADLGYISLSREASVLIENIGVVLFFGTVGLFSLWIVWEFLRNLRLLRRDRAGRPIPRGGPLVVDRGKFGLGLAGLAVFAVVLGVGLGAKIRGRSVLAFADNFFNQLAKDSANHIDEARKELDGRAEKYVDLGIQPREHATEADLLAVIGASGCHAGVTDDGRTRIQGRMGALAGAAVADAELAFANRTAELQAKYHMRAEEVIYCWWIVFDGLARRYVQENRSADADFARFVSAKVLEPAYNFRGIEAQGIRRNVLPLAGFLGFSLLYTLWYGFSILLVMEGFGITVTLVKGRKET